MMVNLTDLACSYWSSVKADYSFLVVISFLKWDCYRY